MNHSAGRRRRRDDARTAHTTPAQDGTRNALDTARDAFTALVTGPDPLSVNGRRFDGLPDRRLRLDEVRIRLLEPDCPQPARDAVWAYLVKRARTPDPVWRVAAVGMAMPALTSMTAELTRRLHGDTSDIASEVLRGFLAGLAHVDLT